MLITSADFILLQVMYTFRLVLIAVVTFVTSVLAAQTVSIPILGCNCGPTSKYNFIATLTDGDTFHLKSKVEFDEVENSWFLTYKDGTEETRLWPYQTKQLLVTDYSNYSMIGLPTDSVWLFNTGMGKINMYSPLPVYQTEDIIAIQEGSGPILPLSSKNLLPMLTGDDRAIKTAQKGKLYKAARLFNLGEE